MSVSVLIKLIIPMSLTATSSMFYKTSPEIFLISTLAGVAFGILQESFLKKYLILDDRIFRHQMLTGLSSIYNVWQYLEMKAHVLGNYTFVQNKHCIRGGFSAGYCIGLKILS